MRVIGLGANWGEARGYSVLTNNGLQLLSPTTPLQVIPSESIFTFNGTNYGFSAFLTPRPKCQITLNYNKTTDSTVGGLKTTFGDVSRWNGQLRYPWRKMYLDGGVTRVSQTLSTAGATGVTFTTYFVGISRWFNFF
jgi:hypothetical protein